MRKARKTYRKTCKKNRNGRKSRKSRRKCKYGGGMENDITILQTYQKDVIKNLINLSMKEFPPKNDITNIIKKDIAKFIVKHNAIKKSYTSTHNELGYGREVNNDINEINEIVTDLYTRLYIFNSKFPQSYIDICDIKLFNNENPTINYETVQQFRGYTTFRNSSDL